MALMNQLARFRIISLTALRIYNQHPIATTLQATQPAYQVPPNLLRKLPKEFIIEMLQFANCQRDDERISYSLTR
jgi:hypothetical protein